MTPALQQLIRMLIEQVLDERGAECADPAGATAPQSAPTSDLQEA